MRRKILTLLICVLCVVSCGAGAHAFASDTQPEFTADVFTVRGSMTKQTTEDGVFFTGEGGAYYNTPVSAVREVDAEIKFKYHSTGDCWATVCFYAQPAGGHIGMQRADGLVLLIRYSGGILNFNLYKNERDKSFSIVRENYPSAASAEEFNTVSLVRIGGRYTICVNGAEIPDYKNLIAANFPNNEFLTAEGKTYVAVGSYKGVDITVKGIANPATEANASTWIYEEGTLTERDGSLLIESPHALNNIVRDGNYVEWSLADGTHISSDGAILLGLNKTRIEAVTANLYVKLTGGDEITAAVYIGDTEYCAYDTSLTADEIKTIALRNFDKCYRLEINGKGVAYPAFEIKDFARSKANSNVYCSVATTGSGTAFALEFIDSSDGQFNKPSVFDIRNWNDFAESTEEHDDKIVVVKSTWCTERMSTAYESADFAVDWNEIDSFTFAFAASGYVPEFGKGGAKGATFVFTRINGETYLDAFVTDPRTATHVLAAHRVEIGGEFSVTFKKIVGGGMALAVNGERILRGGKDPFGAYGASAVSNASGYNMLCVAANAAPVTVLGVESRLFDTSPVVADSGMTAEEGIGMDPDEWKTVGNDNVPIQNGVYVNERGGLHLCYYEPKSSVYCNTLTTALDADFVSFTVDIENLADSSRQDAWIAFALGNNPHGLLAVPDPNVRVDADGVIFMIKNVGGLMYLSIYERYGYKFTELLGPVAAYDSATGVFEFTAVYYDYEMSLFVNGAKYTDESGKNPLEKVSRVNYSAKGKTYLGTAFYAAATDVHGRDARSVVLYGIRNASDSTVERLLKEEGFEIHNRKFDDVFPPQTEDNTAAVCLCISGGIILAGGVAFAVYEILHRKRRARNEEK